MERALKASINTLDRKGPQRLRSRYVWDRQDRKWGVLPRYVGYVDRTVSVSDHKTRHIEYTLYLRGERVRKYGDDYGTGFHAADFRDGLQNAKRDLRNRGRARRRAAGK